MDSEQRALKEKKRKELLEELEKQQKEAQIQQGQQPMIFSGSLFGNRNTYQKRVPDVDEIKLTKE